MEKVAVKGDSRAEFYSEWRISLPIPSHKLAVSTVDRSFFACFLSSSHRWWSTIGLELNCEDQLPGWRSVDDGDDVAASGQDGTHFKRELCRHELNSVLVVRAMKISWRLRELKN